MGAQGLKVEIITLEEWVDSLHWRNDPLVYRWNKTNRPVELSEHKAWFMGRRNRMVQEPILSYHLKDMFIGIARLDLISFSTYEISVIVNPERRGRGNGKLILTDICSSNTFIPAHSNLIAVIHKMNNASQKLFGHFEFQFLRTEGDFHTYQRFASK